MLFISGTATVLLASIIAVVINDLTPLGGKDLDEKLAEAQ